MADCKSLLFFNKEGDNLNFNFIDANDRFEGDMIFSENSTDTFKTIGLYIFEHIPSFEYELSSTLQLNKFQLFNEYGFNFFRGINVNKNINMIDCVNISSKFSSKWIYGDNFDTLFPKGTLIRFDEKILEFKNNNQSYIVVSVKDNAIMIISNTTNDLFYTQYPEYNDVNTYINKTISAVNCIGVYKYIDSTYKDNLSSWNEKTFYDNLYVNKNLKIINSLYNDGKYDITNCNLYDNIYSNFIVTKKDIKQYYTKSTTNYFTIQVTLLTDLPLLYSGSIAFKSVTMSNTIKNDLYFNNIPSILKPGMDINILKGVNSTIYTIDDINSFENDNMMKYYNTNDLVLYDNKIYQCINGYTQSYADNATKFIVPDTYIDVWTSSITHIPVKQRVGNSVDDCQLYLTTNTMTYTQEYVNNTDDYADNYASLLAMTVNHYKSQMSYLNIDLKYEKDKLIAKSVYPSKYINIDFYLNDNKVSNSEIEYEKIIEVKQPLIEEKNNNYSDIFYKSIVFTDIDNYGIKIKVNGQLYNIEVVWAYNGTVVDMERTIDATLKKWLSFYYVDLLKIGIKAELQYVGVVYKSFYNSIKLTSDYPNVEFIVNDVLVGSTANYYIEHSTVLFKNLGKYLIININGDDYEEKTVYKTTPNGDVVPNIKKTIENFIRDYYGYLSDYHIIISNYNNILYFNLNNANAVLYYTISTGEGSYPESADYEITIKYRGNMGVLIASNEITINNIDNSTTSTTNITNDDKLTNFINDGFSCGMVISINNTDYVYQNTEYTIDYVNDNVLNISYEGPLWNTMTASCKESPFITIAFDNGFSKEECKNNGKTGSQISVGEFSNKQFDGNFFINYSENNTYDNIIMTYNTYDIKGVADFIHIQLTNVVYILGSNKILRLSSFDCSYIDSILFDEESDAKFLRYNPINNFLYAVKDKIIYIINPTNTIEPLESTISLLYNIKDMCINEYNGDIYISTETVLYIYNIDNTLIQTLNISVGDMLYHTADKDMYVIDGTHIIDVIDGDTHTIIRNIDFGDNILKGDMIYSPFNQAIYVFTDKCLYKIKDNTLKAIVDIPSADDNRMYIDTLSKNLIISDSSNYVSVISQTSDNDNIVFQSPQGDCGEICTSAYDGNIYMASNKDNMIYIINSVNGELVHIQAVESTPVKVLYNPDSKMVCILLPSTPTLYQIKVTLNTDIADIKYININNTNNSYGTLDENYLQHNHMWLKTRDYIRRPRENVDNEPQVSYYWKWEDDTHPEFFMYDFSGDLLPNSGSYAYVGVKPLSPVVLNKTPNKDITKVSYSEYQQTIFDIITYSLDYINTETTTDKPTPLQLFIGYQDKTDGYSSSNLLLYKHEKITLTYSCDVNNETNISFKTATDDDDAYYGIITINANSDDNFYGKNLKKGQLITLSIIDITNSDNKYISLNNGLIVKIREIYYKQLIVDFINSDDVMYVEDTVIYDYPKDNDITYLKLIIDVADKNIAKIKLYGQTEEEDFRYRIELNNTGKLLEPDDIFIFKDYDILEGGTDFSFLNKKRKELLFNRQEIFPYIGSYKAIINAINYFGYNDLELYEYFRCIDYTSENFLTMFKEHIPNIFDNTIDGFSESDFVMSNYPNKNYEATNLFNLTYNITDIDGNIISKYTLDEIIIKLQGLKYWLQKHIIPITHKIKDIVGQTYFNETYQISHTNYDITILNTYENMTPLTFKLREAYLMPINSGSDVYNCVVDFYSIIDGVGADKTLGGCKENIPTAYHGLNTDLPTHFTVDIKTYMTYKEWSPFTTYILGDRVYYESKLYESVVEGDNKAISPLRYATISNWDKNTHYTFTNIVKYKNDIYAYINENDDEFMTASTPSYNNTDWKNITYWKEIAYEPIQSIHEFRKIPQPNGITDSNPILPLNFTVDANIDPFISITVTSENGYGLIYSDRKNYEIRSIKNMNKDVRYIDMLGPFTPIVYK